jgi:hypothetical protein
MRSLYLGLILVIFSSCGKRPTAAISMGRTEMREILVKQQLRDCPLVLHRVLPIKVLAEKIVADIFFEENCRELKAEDERELFKWSCKQATNHIRFVGRPKSKTLDLQEENKLSLYRKRCLLYTGIIPEQPKEENLLENAAQRSLASEKEN